MTFQRKVESEAFEICMTTFKFTTLDEYDRNKNKKPINIKHTNLLRPEMYHNLRLQFETLHAILIEELKNDSDFIKQHEKEEHEKEMQLQYDILIENSFSKPDYENTLQVMIDRSCMAKNRVIEQHEKAIVKALNDGIKVADEILKDYPNLFLKCS